MCLRRPSMPPDAARARAAPSPPPYHAGGFCPRARVCVWYHPRPPCAGHTFGAFVAEQWRDEGRYGYFGNGETFLYKMQPAFARYGWTRANSHFVLTSAECIAFGGGGGFALYLDSSLEYGSSAHSPTFNNEVLAGSANFKVIKVEVWGFA